MLVNLVFAAAEPGVANPVSFDLWTLIFQSINVLVVMGVLYFLLFKPVAGIMQKREEFVENQLAHAATSREEAERLLAEYQAQIKNAKRRSPADRREGDERTPKSTAASRREGGRLEAQTMLAQSEGGDRGREGKGARRDQR